MRSVLLLALTLVVSSAHAQPLPGQVIRDPANGSYLALNQDHDRDGRPDPFFLIGPGDPEGLLYLGNRQGDGTREAGRQLEIIEQVRRNGGNAIYFQSIRSHGGDGKPDHNPFIDPANPESGINPAIIRQWRTWFDQLRDANVVALLFLYDDGAHPFDDGCRETIGATEEAYIRDLVNAFEDYPNLVWVVQEEFKFVGHSGQRRICDQARITRAGRVAERIKHYDDHDHLIGVHHNIGDDMQFPDHPAINVYLQQADVRPSEQKGTFEALHAAGQPGHGFDPEHRFVYLMSEGYNWHPQLAEKKDRTTLRRTYLSTAMSGGYVTVLGMYPTEQGADPTDDMLADFRRLQGFFETSGFNRMAPADHLAAGSVDWVLGGMDEYILCTVDTTADPGIRDVPEGRYSIRWFDPENGRSVTQNGVAVGGATTFPRPEGFPGDILLYLRHE